ncbi:MAG: class I adenylate-forming enzyme family protein [Ilumatobacteraceae bacterium]
MADLVAIDLPGGPAFVRVLRDIWDAGDAALPLDQRLPPPAREQVLAATRPTRVVDAIGSTTLEGVPVEDGDALVMVTSGSTGTPKGVVLTHDALTASALATSRRLGVSADDHWLACLPLSHIGGFSVITKALATGTALTVLPAFDAAAVTDAARAGSTLVSLVPTALARIDPALFRVIVLGGSRPPTDRPSNCVATYGMTETGSGIVYDGVPLDGVEVRLEDDGEVLVRGPMLLRCYRDDTTPLDPGGWLHTGDVGTWLDDGRLHVLGRRGDLIITGGENVWPDAVERHLTDHPDVVEVAVAGVDDQEWGQRVVAWIVPRDAAAPPSLDGIRAWARDRMPAYMAPRELVVVTSLPRTALGKVPRRSLVEWGDRG